jgi:hypothetical protein
MIWQVEVVEFQMKPEHFESLKQSAPHSIADLVKKYELQFLKHGVKNV